MSITLKKIAKLAGYSLTTASRVANGDPNVSEEARERILSVMRENGYKPNMAARSLALQKGKREDRNCG
ncbi:LacI family DNA-binding transcriptional regulator [Ornatilinea apprima]|uniref:LacI family DNA-binding transcriptional regulator n=1 Tax=Ornatilinea apprima TaxID=1134406 RepID=UPI0009467A49|nr:LacI family DNA-binding transcriptional regulator [Ornatilinea apprima]